MAHFAGPLGRKPPTDDRHLQRYSLTAETIPTVPTPVVLGVNWYRGFDKPQPKRRGQYWFPPQEQWGSIRGGHAICLKPPALTDHGSWHEFYNQGREGACVGFAVSRMMTLLNRRRYDGRWVYHQALKIDEWPGEADEGTSVRAGCDVARLQGLLRFVRHGDAGPHLQDGIDTNRWARSIEDIAACLNPADPALVLNLGYVTMLNSWGRNYHHLVRIPLESLHRLIFLENGDATVVVDK